MKPTTHRSLGSACALALLLTACVEGRIGMFRVEPNPACRDHTVHITYGAEAGSPVLESSPPIAGLTYDPRERNGVVSVVARNDSRITFTAKGNSASEARSIDLVVRDPSAPIELAPAGTCPGGGFRQVLPIDQWPEGSQVVTVTNLESVPVTITHLAVTQTLGSAGTADAVTAAFGGQLLVGDWTLSRMLLPGECPPGCGMASPCPELGAVRVAVTWRCPPR